MNQTRNALGIPECRYNLGPEFNTVLVNGRILATENSGREFSFDVLSSSLIKTALVYKSPTAELQEGGIGATVNILTARPFDSKKGLHTTLSGGAVYDTLSERAGPDFSGVVSWLSDSGNFGALVSASYNNRLATTDFLDVDGWSNDATGQPILGGTDASVGLTNADTGFTRTGVALPRAVSFFRRELDNERLNIGGALQGRLAEGLILTIDGLYSKYDNFQTSANGTYFAAQFYQDLVFNENGTVTSYRKPGRDFVADNPGVTGNLPQELDNAFQFQNRATDTYQYGANLQWDVNDRLKLNFDASQSKATRNQLDSAFVIFSQSSTSVTFDLNPEDDLPSLTGAGPQLTDINAKTFGFQGIFETDVEDETTEFHIDVDYEIDSGIFRGIKAGGLYVSREKTSNFALNLPTLCVYCASTVPIPASALITVDSSNFLSGASGGAGLRPSTFISTTLDRLERALNDPASIALGLQANDPTLSAAAAAARAQEIIANGGILARVAQPGAFSSVKEDVAAAYINANFGGDRWSANLGGRLVFTNTTSSGFAQELTGITLAGGITNALNFEFSAPRDVSIDNNYINFLPAFNLSYEVTPSSMLRVGISSTVTRPTLTSLGVNNNFAGRATSATSSGGNPELRPFRSTNYDLSYEYYLDDVSYIGAAAFYKSFSDFLEQRTEQVTRFGFVFNDTRIRNGQTGSIAGAEIGGQYFFDQLPGFASGFGVAGNYTYVKSSVQREAGAADCGYNGLSPHSFNASGIYEKYGIEARVSYNWRSEYLIACAGSNGVQQFREAYGQLDLTAAYNINKSFQVYFQGINLSRSPIRDYSLFQERTLRYDVFGTRYLAGVRATF
jgi:TonB-dependent receptor